MKRVINRILEIKNTRKNIFKPGVLDLEANTFDKPLQVLSRTKEER